MTRLSGRLRKGKKCGAIGPRLEEELGSRARMYIRSKTKKVIWSRNVLLVHGELGEEIVKEEAVEI